MSDKPKTQTLHVNGSEVHGAMGEVPVAEIPQQLIEMGQEQVERGAHFYGKKLSECSRDELYAAIVAAGMEIERRGVLMAELMARQEQQDPAPTPEGGE